MDGALDWLLACARLVAPAVSGGSVGGLARAGSGDGSAAAPTATLSSRRLLISLCSSAMAL
eukprot:13992971-Heterocapsa_arctica.AAC.1